MADARIGVKGTGDASAEGGVVFVNTGAVTGDVNLHAPRTAVSGYLLQVERMAAADFRGREAELSELASFGTEARSPGVSEKNYWRWLAPAWAGKSALLAEFVLNPPPGIDVVAFFITSRMAGQNDAAAFCEVVQRQLYALLREEEPLSTPHTRDEQMRLALDRAAERSAAEGRRLVLVVDGLDEDHGVTAGPDCHSIAALLPRTPRHGMRIVVAGRPHPPVPDDVPGDHPLWTTEINHWLEPSPHAQATRRDAEQDLLRLLDGGGLGRELVSLTVAAGGGLSANDIAELTGSRPRRVERELSAASGRSFRRRSAHWTPGGPEVYLLAHEEIQRSATDLVTDAELADCRTRLHRWAETYRSTGWPPTTPAYLLRGYAQLLRELGDTGRLVELVCDAARQERLWQVTGADLEALSELSTSLDQLLAHSRQSGDPDVPAALRLAAARDGLHRRTGALPAELIGLWARLGHTGRAISMAKSQRKPYDRVRALAAVAAHLAATGHGEQAEALTEDADSREDRDRVLGAVADGLAEAGQYTEALRTASRVETTERRAEALVATVRAVAEAGAWQRSGGKDAVTRHAVEAAQAAAGVPNTVTRGELFADLACSFSLLGEDRRAAETTERAVRASAGERPYRQSQNLSHISVRLTKAPLLAATAAEFARRSAELAGTIDDPPGVSWLFPQVAEALAATGQHEHAAAVIDRFLPDPFDRDDGLYTIALATAESGDPDTALLSVDRLTEPLHRFSVLHAIGRALAKSADPVRAAQLAQSCLDAIDEVPDPLRRVRPLTGTAELLLRSGHGERAGTLVETATDLARESRAPVAGLTTQIAVAGALASVGADDEAYRLVRGAAASVEAISDDYIRVRSLVEVARGLHSTGRDDQKDALLSGLLKAVREDPDDELFSDAMRHIAEAFGETGSPDRSREVAVELLAGAEALDSPYEQSWYRYHAAGAFLAAGDFDRALALTGALPEDEEDGDFLSSVAEKVVETGDLDRSRLIADAITGTVAGERSLGHIAAGAAAAGDLPRAVALLGEISTVPLREGSTVAVVRAAARSGAAEEAQGLAEALTVPDHRSKALGAIAHAHGPTPTGRRLLVEALALGPWDQLVEAIAGVAPEHLLLLADLSRGER